MDKFKEIRPVVLGILKHNNKVLVGKGYDSVKQEYFYRSLGGGIEFLETSEQALKREYLEEIGEEINVLDKLDVIENIFQFEGKDAHELLFIYNIELINKNILPQYKIIDEEDNYAEWIDIDDFKTDEKIIYPRIVKEYL